jgi:hypothetical protein
MVFPLALRAEYLAPFATSMRMMTSVETEKALVGGLQLLNSLLYVNYSFTVLRPMALIFTKYTEWFY